mmetsp:Transcript_15660/g.37136  ORF Transcript_15660/g.37136 Transcript_15660/m.37136 type:complete len:220 (-) Transcript_15660:746-1405(-)
MGGTGHPRDSEGNQQKASSKEDPQDRQGDGEPGLQQPAGIRNQAPQRQLRRDLVMRRAVGIHESKALLAHVKNRILVQEKRNAKDRLVHLFHRLEGIAELTNAHPFAEIGLWPPVNFHALFRKTEFHLDGGECRLTYSRHLFVLVRDTLELPAMRMPLKAWRHALVWQSAVGIDGRNEIVEDRWWEVCQGRACVHHCHSEVSCHSCYQAVIDHHALRSD